MLRTKERTFKLLNAGLFVLQMYKVSIYLSPGQNAWKDVLNKQKKKRIFVAPILTRPIMRELEAKTEKKVTQIKCHLHFWESDRKTERVNNKEFKERQLFKTDEKVRRG